MNKPIVLEQACKCMLDKELGEVETAGNHDIGIFVLGLFLYSKKPCSNFIPDDPTNYKYNPERCTTYKKYNELRNT
jgi:hypothetical protein